MTTQGLRRLPDALLSAGSAQEPQPLLSGAPQRLSDREYGGLLQPQRAGARVSAMTRLVGHFCAQGETRTTIYRILSLWNEKNLPALESEEFEYQFNSMYSRWGAPREELTFAEEIGQVGTFDDPHERREALIHLLAGRHLPAMEYELWKERLKHDYGLSKGTFESLVRRVSASSNGHGPNPQAPVDVEGEQRVAAIALLTDPALLHKVLLAMQKDGLVGEEGNSLAVYMAATSRHMNDPMNLVVQGDSSTGKTFLTMRALALIPPEEKIIRQRYSAQAIVHTDLSFVHKVISILELPGAEAANYNIRTLQSEKVIDIEVTVKKEDGTFGTETTTKEGPASFIITTVEAKLDAQNASRVWLLTPDDSVAQSHRVTMAQTKSWGLTEEELMLFWDAQRMLAPVGVARPEPLLVAVHDGMWHNLGEAPPRIRRDHNHLIELVRTSAFLHQYQREIDDAGQVVPDIRDYYIVYQVAARSFQQSLRTEARQQLIDLLQALQDMFLDRGEAIPIEELASRLDWSRGKTYDWLGVAMETGRCRREGRGLYLPTTSLATTGAVLPHPNEVIERDPTLARGQELIDPMTGEELVFEP